MKRHVLHVFPNFGFGGIQVRFARVANGLADEFRHTVVALGGETSCRALFAPSVDARFVEAPQKGNFAQTVGAAIRTIRDVGPDLLVTYNWGSILFALANGLFSGPGHIHCEDGFGPEEAARQLRRRTLFRRLALRRTKAIVVPSKTLVRIARDQWRVPEEKLWYLPNGIDIAELDDKAREPLAVSDLDLFSEPPVVITVAALRPEKNIARLIEAFALALRSSPGRLIVIGDGAERPMLQSLAVKCGIGAHVHFLGHRNNPAPYIARSQVFALSSDTEQMPMTVLEAMALGKAVASVDVGDVRDMLCPANADQVVGAGDTSALAAALGRMLSDANFRRQIGEDNRRVVITRYGFNQMLGNWRRAFSI